LSIVIRILRVIGAYLLACVAASIVLTFGTLTSEWDDLLSLSVQTGTVAPVIAFGAALIAIVATVPAMLVIALAEGFAWRSVVLYGALGGALALALYYGLGFAGFADEPDGDNFLARTREVLAAAGISGGLVYWLFAGRKAGLWRHPG